MKPISQHSHVKEAKDRRPESKSTTNVPYLDGIRGLAVLSVFIFHCWWLSGEPEINPGLSITPFLKFSQTAIDLFFVLSAFLLSQQWLRADYLHQPRPSLSKYFKQRFFRIVPAYYCCLLIMLVAFTPGYLSPRIVYSADGLGYLVAHLTFTHYLFPASSGVYTINTTFWTLTHEVTFYLVLPWFILLFLRNRWRKTLPILFIISLVWLFLTKFSLDSVVSFWQNLTTAPLNEEKYIRNFLSLQFIKFMVDFGLGIVAANLFVQKSLNLPMSKAAKYFTHQTIANKYFLVGCIVIISSGYLAKDLIFNYFLLHIFVALGYTLILMGLVFGGENVKKIFSTPLLRYTGEIGYSVFLWHMPLIYYYRNLAPIASLEPAYRMLAVIVVTGISVGILATVSYRFIEKPFMEYSRRTKTFQKKDQKLLDPNLEADTLT